MADGARIRLESRRFAAVREASFVPALVLAMMLLVANLFVRPSFVAPGSLPETLGLAAPLLIAAMASTPSIVSGGIDISVGPLLALSNVLYVSTLVPHGLGSGWVAIPILVALGAAVGFINGIAVTMLRFPPVLATLCMFFVLGGVSLQLLPTPSAAPSNWTTHIAGTVLFFPGALLTLGAVVLIWAVLGRTAYLCNLFAVGANDAAALASGVQVAAVRIGAYVVGGIFAAIGGIALTGVLQGGDAGLSTTYTLVAIAAVALGGTSLAGGRGGLAGALLGGLCVYLIQSLLSSLGVSAGWLPVTYGVLLLVGLLVASRQLLAKSRVTAA